MCDNPQAIIKLLGLDGVICHAELSSTMIMVGPAD